MFATGGVGIMPFAGMYPLDRVKVTFDGGLGRAFHNVSVFGPGGNQVIRSNDSSFAWMLRGAAIYQITDYIGIGVFVSHFRADGITAFLANGNPFALGGRSETAAGATLSISFDSASLAQFAGGFETATVPRRAPRFTPATRL